jgi:hypothetical protein
MKLTCNGENPELLVDITLDHDTDRINILANGSCILSIVNDGTLHRLPITPKDETMGFQKAKDGKILDVWDKA